MIFRHVKTGVMYLAFICLGGMLGYFIINHKRIFAVNYIEGNYNKHFSNVNNPILIYGTDACEFCQEARKYLRERDIRFYDIDIDTNDDGRVQFEGLNEGGIPA
ncbi:MAG: glutaredoxin, partial [Undibacterium sp.]|nr:glutaredoxin [Undibacterium sp.]